MSPSLDHNKISFTAKLVAYFRQFFDIPFAHEVAQYIGAEHAFESLFPERGVARDELMEYSPILEARYKSIVSLITGSGIQQVLELAGGFSLRGFAMARNASITYIDTDLATLNSEKAKLISELRSKHEIPNLGNYHIATANALDLAELRAAIRPFRRDHPIVIVNEGLVIYFSPFERMTLAKNVRALLQEFGGVWITPDFSSKTDAKDATAGRRRFREAVAGLTDRVCMNAAFETNEEMSEFFAEFGFQAEIHYQMEEAPHLVSVQTLGISPQIIDREKPELKVWVLRAT